MRVYKHIFISTHISFMKCTK